jgi:hypothetical protein
VRDQDDIRPLLNVVDEVMLAGKGALIRRPAEPILIARDGYERYIDSKLNPEDRLEAELAPGVEEAWDALAQSRELRQLVRHEGMGGHPGGGWLWEVDAVDLDDGRRIYVENSSGDVVGDRGIFLVAVTARPSDEADNAAREERLESDQGQASAEARRSEWDDQLEDEEEREDKEDPTDD